MRDVRRLACSKSPRVPADSVVTVTGGSTAPTLASVEISPASVQVAPAGTQAFTAQGRMSDASTSPVSVTWTATGGTISAAGLYTAGAVAGTYSATLTITAI